jgi:hypothetical protein
MKKFWVSMLTAWLVVWGPAAAFAAGGLAASLGEVEWGDSKEKVLEKVEKERKAALKKKVAGMKTFQDRRVEFDRFKDWVERTEKSYVEFGKREQGYATSVVGDEFTPSNQESMIVSREDVAIRYFMFHRERLYKVVVSYNPDYLIEVFQGEDVDFETFVVQVAQKYGRPLALEYDDDDELYESSWQDRKSILKLVNHVDRANTFTMVFSDRERVESMEASGKAFGGSNKREAGEDTISDEVAKLTSGSTSGKGEDTVGELVGELDIDYSKGRPADEKLRQEGGDDEAKKEAKSKASKKKKKKKKKRKKRKKKKSFDKLKKKGGDELIIY